MKASEELSYIREAQQDIIIMSERSAYLRSTLYGRGQRYDLDRVQTSPTDMMCERLSEVCDHDARIRKRQKKLDRRKDIMRENLERLDNPDHIRVLDLFYLSLTSNGRLLSWSDVAKIVGKSRRTVFRQASDAEKILDDILYIY